MTKQATGTFEIESWDEKPYNEMEGAKLTRTQVTKTFHGDIEGESSAELLMAYGSEEGSAAYVGFERIVGRVSDRSGSFVLHHTASSSPNGQTASWSIVPNSATGELAGLSGEAQVSVDSEGGHTFTLDYEFE